MWNRGHEEERERRKTSDGIMKKNEFEEESKMK